MKAVCCRLTAPGRGAVAVVAVEGEEAVAVVDKLFVAASGRPLDQQPVGSVRFGRWGSERGEEVVVVRRAGSLEVHCHGGRAASSAVVASLVAEGATEISSDEWLGRREPSPFRAMAWRALQQATTERVALLLLDQWQGALERDLEGVLHLLAEGELAAAAARLDRLGSTWEVGRWITRPPQVVLTGRPNVGKSRLLNALLGYERAIVFDRPGTTRDVVRGETAFDGWPVVLSDTAGLREEAEEEIERAGMELAQEALASADVVIEVVDATQEEEGASLGRPIRVANKIDLVDEARRAWWEGKDYLPTSAATGEGLEGLVAAIVARIAPVEPEPGEGVLLSPDDARDVAEAMAACQQGRGKDASRLIESLLAKLRGEANGDLP